LEAKDCCEIGKKPAFLIPQLERKRANGSNWLPKVQIGSNGLPKVQAGVTLQEEQEAWSWLR